MWKGGKNRVSTKSREINTTIQVGSVLVLNVKRIYMEKRQVNSTRHQNPTQAPSKV